MLELFQWFYLQKIEGRNPFWRLLELVVESNDKENVNNAQVDEIPDVEGAAVGSDDDEEDAEEGEDYESQQEEDSDLLGDPIHPSNVLLLCPC